MPPIATNEYSEQLNSMNRYKPERATNMKMTSVKKGGRAIDKKKYSDPCSGDSESLSGSSFFKSERSVSGSVETSKSYATSCISEFYSSRRSFNSIQGSLHSSAKITAIEKQSPLTDRTWNDNEGQKPDTSPRRPTKRNSIDYAGEQSAYQPIGKNDTSPRRPTKRNSLDYTGEQSTYQTIGKDVEVSQSLNKDAAPCQPIDQSSRAEVIDSSSERPSDQPIRTTITDENDQRDSSPRKPRKRMSISGGDDPCGQEIYIAIPDNASSKGDTSPQRPKQRGSFTELPTTSTEFQFNSSSEDIENDNIQEEIIVQVPTEDVQKKRVHREIIVELPNEGINKHNQKSSGSGYSVTSDISCQSNDEKLYSRLKMTVPSNFKAMQQRNVLRRQHSQKSIESSSSQVRSIATRDTDSSGSIMSIQSHMSLSMKIRSLIELTADVVNAETLEVAAKHYQKSIHAAGSEIMNINIQMGNMIGQDCSASVTARNGCHEDLRLIGIIIGLLLYTNQLRDHIHQYFRT